MGQSKLEDNYVLYYGVNPPSCIPKHYFEDSKMRALIRKRLNAPNLGKKIEKTDEFCWW